MTDPRCTECTLSTRSSAVATVDHAMAVLIYNLPLLHMLSTIMNE